MLQQNKLYILLVKININYIMYDKSIILITVFINNVIMRSKQQTNKMDQEVNSAGLSNSSSSRAKSRQLFALIGQDSLEMRPYRSKFQIKSIGSGSRASRDSDLLNQLCEDHQKSSKSLSRNVSNSNLNNKSMLKSSSNSMISEGGRSNSIKNQNKTIQIKQAPKIHNCVCFAAGQCLSYNCNCFLSPFPCAPQCCPNCLTLKSNLPHKITNICSCKKTKCLKLYCECLSKGHFCTVMCRCQLCENHEHSASRASSLNNLTFFQGCTCAKSRCIKKYCQCYAQGIKCTKKCICIGCKNYIQGEMQDQYSKNTIKKQQIRNKKDQNQYMSDQLQFQQIDFYGSKRMV